jgi:gluconolactonase
MHALAEPGAALDARTAAGAGAESPSAANPPACRNVRRAKGVEARSGLGNIVSSQAAGRGQFHEPQFTQSRFSMLSWTAERNPTMNDLAQTPWPPGVEPAPLTAVASVAFTEGPAVDADGTVYFSDIINNRILKVAPGGGPWTVFREPSHRTNGQTFDLQGRLLHCEGAEFGPGGGRRVTRTTLATGKYETLTDRYEGRRYNSPNDICVDGQGRIFFTDPRYGDRSGMEMSVEGVYRIDLDGGVTRILDNAAVDRPNGVAVTQDARLLYVVDNCPVAGGNRKVWSFALDPQGAPHDRRLIFDFAPGRGGDGMRIDVDGNLYVAAGLYASRHAEETTDVPTGVYKFSPRGELLGRIPVAEDVITNLAFGGPDGRTIYITAGKSLYMARVPAPGQVAWPKWTASS